MARPRIFVSSTYYDLKHVRSSLDDFIQSLGFDSILSEKGDIAFTHDRALDESCYREAAGADILVLIVGGRYGSEASSTEKKLGKEFFDRYESITKKEYQSAVQRDIPIYILIEAGVYNEFHTFLRNKENTLINYAQVESVNVFYLIEEILSQPRNNPIKPFERFAEIESWLREQWAGLFRELLTKESSQKQLLELTSQVSQLKEVNETLRKYLEVVIAAVDPKSTNLIATETQRLEEREKSERIRNNGWYLYTERTTKISQDQFVEAVAKSSNANQFGERLREFGADSLNIDSLVNILKTVQAAQRDFNEARTVLGLPAINSFE